LRQALMPTLEALYRQDPESLPFRQPVDPMVLGIPVSDYFDIVKNPIDLSTIKRKLDTGQYQEPWQYVDDIWLMFNNAWLYNRKTSRVYKYCTKLAEVFEAEIDPVMQGLGYCCGRKDIFKQATEDRLTSANELPYFEGDFWPNVLEESIKELEQEEEERKKEENTASSETTEVFFVIHLHSGPVINTLPPIMDPDPLLTCDLMDGRDAFLTLARDKHWEFSSLRRCKWSSMCMLVELHNQGQDRFVYTCNECKHHVETRWHCTVCE
ncbi:hypothetical protein XENOCAPTIV_012464, partial [Xenoophorus captivus]